jgi:hypothetical protein
MNTKKSYGKYREALELRQLADDYYQRKDEKRSPSVGVVGVCVVILIILTLIAL